MWGNFFFFDSTRFIFVEYSNNKQNNTEETNFTFSWKWWECFFAHISNNSDGLPGQSHLMPQSTNPLINWNWFYFSWPNFTLKCTRTLWEIKRRSIMWQRQNIANFIRPNLNTHWFERKNIYGNVIHWAELHKPNVPIGEKKNSYKANLMY